MTNRRYNACRKIETSCACTPTSSYQTSICRLLLSLYITIAVAPAPPWLPVVHVQALQVSFAVSNSALRIVQNMASAVAAPPNVKAPRVFGNPVLANDEERETGQGVIKGRNGVRVVQNQYEALNGAIINGKAQPKANGVSQTVYSSLHTMNLKNGDHSTAATPPALKNATKNLVRDGEAIYSTSTKMPDAYKEVVEKDDPKEQVWTALSNLESNMELLDEVAGQKQQLNVLEFSILSSCILAAAAAPLMGGSLTEFIAPSAAATCAAIGIGAEYVGKVAVADGKEVAAISIQCAAEAEAVLAQAERSKAIAPLCVGIGATSATCSLLIPAVLEASGLTYSVPGVRELYLLCPVASILSAAIAGLSFQETRQYCTTAIGVGNRRFARSGSVGRTWMSAAEQISEKSVTGRNKLITFAISVLPAPIVGTLIPGSLATKTIAISAIAAAESAWYLTKAEFTLARAVDAVALKTRSAAVCDTYANQGSRSAAILPYTSALSALCAATTAAVVELPFFEASTSAVVVAGQVLGISIFPAFAALFAGAASVSKARCELDSEAAMEAASTLAVEYEEGSKSPIIEPTRAVMQLINLSLKNSVAKPLRRVFRRLGFVLRFPRRWFFRRSLRRAFMVFDSDRDGILSAAELRRCVNKLGVSLTAEEVNEMVQAYDQDGDGRITYREFRNMMISG